MSQPRTFFRSINALLVVSLILLLTALLLLIPTETIRAQEAGVSIRPAVIEETLDPGIFKQYSITIRNLNDADQRYYLFTRNISGVKDGGVPIFANDNLERTGFELASWIDLPVTEVDLRAREEVTVEFFMQVPENASPGGHFGGVFVSVDPPNIENSGAAVAYQVANIIAIRVSGDAVEEASIRQFSTSKFLYGSQNVEFSVRIENTGNVLIRPVGPFEIYNMLGKKVGNLVFNENQAGVFPGATQTFSNIIWERDSVGFGRYEAIVSPIFGDQGAKKTISSTVTFWILPMNIIGPALLAFAFVLLTVFIAVRLYVKRSIAHLSQGRRLIQRRRKGGSSLLLLVLVVTLTVTALFLLALLILFA
jgi:hypothetical protein